MCHGPRWKLRRCFAMTRHNRKFRSIENELFCAILLSITFMRTSSFDIINRNHRKNPNCLLSIHEKSTKTTLRIDRPANSPKKKLILQTSAKLFSTQQGCLLRLARQPIYILHGDNDDLKHTQENSPMDVSYA